MQEIYDSVLPKTVGHDSTVNVQTVTFSVSFASKHAPFDV